MIKMYHEIPFPLLKRSFIRAYKIWFVKVEIYWSRCSQTVKGNAECLSFLKKIHLKVKTNQEHFVWRMAKQKKQTFICAKMWFCLSPIQIQMRVFLPILLSVMVTFWRVRSILFWEYSPLKCQLSRGMIAYLTFLLILSSLWPGLSWDYHDLGLSWL